MDIDTKDPEFLAKVKEEARKLRLLEQQLSEPHLARLQESLKLNETKMANIEENLERTRTQKDRVKRFQELLLELNEQKQHLYEVNKMLASNIKEREQLERFEAFENVQGHYQRMTVLEQLRHEQKQRLTLLTRNFDEASRNADEEQKRLTSRREEMKESHRRLLVGLESVGEAQATEGKISFISLVEGRLEDSLTLLNNRADRIDHEINDLTLEIESQQADLDRLYTRRQTIEAHHRTAEHGELIVERLNQLAQLETENDKANANQRECLRRQTDENEMLGRVYAEYQHIQQEMESVNSELSGHREQNHGLDSYKLQERAIQKQLRREMLLSAQSLWARIADGYERIENCLQSINALRLNQDNLTNKIDSLEKELVILRKTCKEKEYTFTLSKSQNVIQLRSDLKEGTSCTVCGATHHPYHSDTMLEQNKLIGDMKVEVEGLANELRMKETLLREMQIEYSSVKATRHEAENTLIVLRELQNGFVHDWQMHANLDPTFRECDSSTNAPARTAMLRQLIENIVSEVEEARKELDTYNFHQTRINELTEKFSLLDRRKADIITKLNEVNTGCQVMAFKLEAANAQKQTVSAQCSKLSEILDKMITIPDWMNIWKRNHESLLMRVQEYSKEWFELLDNISSREQNLRLLKQQQNDLKQTHVQLLNDINTVEGAKQNYHTLDEECRKQLDRLVGAKSPKDILKSLLEEDEQASIELNKQQDAHLAAALQQNEMKGRLTENNDSGDIIDGRASGERQKVDLWMAQYNTNHPPVQYSELEMIFGIDRNWNDIRERVRAIELDSMLTQQRVDKLRSQMVALQSEGSINTSDPESIQQQLTIQQETLEARRRETMMNIAQITQQLQLHHTSVNTTREYKMKE